MQARSTPFESHSTSTTTTTGRPTSCATRRPVLIGLLTGVLAVASAGGAGCGGNGNRYTYAPTAAAAPATSATTMSADYVAGRPAALVAIAGGELRFASFGTAQVIPPSGVDLPAFRGLYIRLVVNNTSDDRWIIKESEQRIDAASSNPSPGEALTATHATTPSGILPPTIVVEPHATTSIDLLFGGPPKVLDGSLEAFELVWTVHRGDQQTMTGRVPFQRARVPTLVDRTPPSMYEPALPAIRPTIKYPPYDSE